MGETNAQFRQILDVSPIPFALNDENQNITYLNRAFTRTFGYDLTDIPTLAEWWPRAYPEPAYRERVMKSWQERMEKATREGTQFEALELTIRCKDGSDRIVIVSAVSPGDAPEGVYAVMLYDITERMNLLAAAQRADRLNSLGVLAGGIAHDFNNLLSSIFGYMELARGATTESRVIEYLDRGLSAFSRARGLAQQLLTFARGGDPVMQSGNLGTLLSETCEFVLAGSNVHYQCHVADDLWPCNFDTGQMNQVFSNLLINARQAMPDGGNIGAVASNRSLNETSVHPAGPYVEIQISDSGRGIPAEQISHIFDPFYSTRPGGTGLGLATCFSIIQKHAGFIDVESTPGKGATFRILIPVAKSGNSRGASFAKHSAGEQRLLVMDDEELIRAVSQDLFASAGFSVQVAAHGEEALILCDEAARSGRPFHAAILDLTVPGHMGGKDLARLLKKDHPEIALFASSGYSEDPVMTAPAEYGFVASIRKPYLIADAAQLVRQFLRN